MVRDLEDFSTEPSFSHSVRGNTSPPVVTRYVAERGERVQGEGSGSQSACQSTVSSPTDNITDCSSKHTNTLRHVTTPMPRK